MDNILLTRPERQAEPMKSELERIGFTVFVQPAVEILPPDSWDEVDKVITVLDTFDCIVFTSRNAVEFFFERLRFNGGLPPAALEQLHFAAVGSGTANLLRENLLCENLLCEKTDNGKIIVPENFSAEYLMKTLKSEGITGKRFLFPCGNKRKNVLPNELQKNGGAVKEVEVYRSIDIESVKPEIAAMMSTGKINWMTVTSPAISKSLIRLFGKCLHKTKIVSISPAVSEVLRQEGFTPALEAAQSSAEGMIEALSAVLISGH